MPKTFYDLVKSIAKKNNIDISPARRAPGQNQPAPSGMIRVAAPLARPCGSNTIGQKKRYTKQELVGLARASGIDPNRKTMDELCSILGINPHAVEVDLPSKACNSTARGDNRYTRDDVKRLAMARGIKVTGKTMTELCDAMGINRDDVSDRPIQASSVASSQVSSPPRVRAPSSAILNSPPRSPIISARREPRPESLFDSDVLERGLPVGDGGERGVFSF